MVWSYGYGFFFFFQGKQLGGGGKWTYLLFFIGALITLLNITEPFQAIFPHLFINKDHPIFIL